MLYKFQQDYMHDVKPNWVYDCDTGTGKTVMGLKHYKIFYNNYPLVIFAPASKVKEGGWQRTLEKFKLKAIVISYNKMPKYIPDCLNAFVIFDEAHRIKDSTGVWGKTAFKIVKNYCSGFILLTATPLTNGWIDSINYLKLFGLTKNKTEFMRRFTITDNTRGYPEIVAWKLTKKLEAEWKTISKRLNKKDALDLPEITEKEIRLTASKKYHIIKNSRIYDKKVYDNMFSWRHGLRANVATKDKIEYIKEVLEDISGNVIIFYNYISELEELKKANFNRTVFECNGAKKNYPTPDQWAYTKNTVTLANYKSGSEAVEFTFANIIIFFSPTESYTEYYQALGRCHRLGQENKVTVYKLITQKTIEQAIYESLERKEDFCFERWCTNGK